MNLEHACHHSGSHSLDGSHSCNVLHYQYLLDIFQKRDIQNPAMAGPTSFVPESRERRSGLGSWDLGHN